VHNFCGIDYVMAFCNLFIAALNGALKAPNRYRPEAWRSVAELPAFALVQSYARW
jgi:hypothetical protein